MTQTRKEALTDLLAKMEAGEATRVEVEDGITAIFGLGKSSGDGGSAYAQNNAVAAISFVKATLPGWGWRMAECSVSDDAWVFPDFNCPEHGPRLRATLDESVDWCGLTDVDQRPPGNPARALFQSALIALIAQEPDQ